MLCFVISITPCLLRIWLPTPNTASVQVILACNHLYIAKYRVHAPTIDLQWCEKVFARFLFFCMFVTLKCLRSLSKCLKCSTFWGCLLLLGGKYKPTWPCLKKWCTPPRLQLLLLKGWPSQLLGLGSNHFLLFTWLAVVKGFHLTMEMILQSSTTVIFCGCPGLFVLFI